MFDLLYVFSKYHLITLIEDRVNVLRPEQYWGIQFKMLCIKSMYIHQIIHPVLSFLEKVI